MRILLAVLLTAVFVGPAFPQSAPAPPAQTAAPTTSGKLTKLFCKPLCEKAALGKLAATEMDEFNACADALLCLDAYPPVAVNPRDNLEARPFDFFRLGRGTDG